MSPLCVRSDTRFTKVTLRSVPDRPGIAAELFGRLAAEGFNIELLVSTGGGQGRADISFVIKSDELAAVLRVLDRLKRDLGAQTVEHYVGFALVEVAGPNLSKRPGVAGRMFRALSRQGINIDIISTSLSSVTCAVDERLLQEAEAAVREEFAADV